MPVKVIDLKTNKEEKIKISHFKAMKAAAFQAGTLSKGDETPSFTYDFQREAYYKGKESTRLILEEIARGER